MGRIKTKKYTNKVSNLIRSSGPEIVALGSKTLTGKKKELPGRKYSGSVDILVTDDAEYLYLTNSYIARGVNTNASAVMRNGLEIIPQPGDQKQLDLILEANDIDLLVYDIAKNCELYGVQFIEIFIDPTIKVPRFELLPASEMDYLRDSSQNVMYDSKTGRPAGYIQKRNGNEVARWEGKDALRIAEFKYNTLGGVITGIPSIQSAVYSASEYGYVRNSIADSFIRSLPVAHIQVDGATPEDIEEVTAAVNDRFTARTTYVTSERFTMNNSSPKNDIDVFKFIEPSLAEIAACFNMPIELLASTQYLKSTDFAERYQEWIEHIRVKQKKIASVLKHQVFSVLFDESVTVRFNSPVTVTTAELIKTVGFAVQSNAITQDQAMEILVKNQVFGPYTSSLESNKQTKEKPVDDSNVDEPTE
jgi:hypothetical protein